MKRYILPVILVVCIAIVAVFFANQFSSDAQQPTVSALAQPSAVKNQGIVASNTTGVASNATSSCTGLACQTPTIIDVPFSVQAPFGVWDEVHEETCEETAVMMVAAFYNGETGVIPKKTADTRILHIVDVENQLLGFYKDTSATATAAFTTKTYPSLRVDILPLKSVDDIKRQLQQGIPVILPTDGKKLYNPNFKNGGPKYHMLVIIGYKNGYFITNDPGTRRGKSYLYKENVLFTAAHDWNNGDVPHGKKVMIIITSVGQ
ncbi:MAG: C39 family peptidase [Patescibacteria group bacterium]